MGGFLGTVLTALRSPIGVKGDGQNWRQAQQQCQAQAIFLPWGLIEEVKHKVITISFTSMASQKIDCFNQTFSKKTSYLENPGILHDLHFFLMPSIQDHGGHQPLPGSFAAFCNLPNHSAFPKGSLPKMEKPSSWSWLRPGDCWDGAIDANLTDPG